ncbi:MAG: hypothetical protein ACAI25_20190 [Planctomycetota bacterium]
MKPLRRSIAVLLLASLLFTNPATSQPSGGPTKMRRLVLCLDGLAHRVVADLQQQGKFRDFHPASRMVGTFPSLSNTGWSGLLDLGPEPGYQSYYFSNELNKGVGGNAEEMAGTRYEKRMHHRIHGLISHGLSYVAPFLAAKSHMKTLIRECADHDSSTTAFAYSLETDSLSHMRGRERLEELLEVLESELQTLKDDFRARNGRDLEIAIVSDHGHTLSEGKIVAMEKHLESRGWESKKAITGPKDVAFKLAGILSAIAIHCQPQSSPDLARDAAACDGVDLCARAESASEFVLVSSAGEARFQYNAADDTYRYAGGVADPIGYSAIWKQLSAAGKLDRNGFARQAAVFEATKDHAYPNALARVRHGLTDLVKSPAQVLVSLKPGYEAGMGFVKLAASLVGRNGTHGALAGNDTNGVYMTNFKATPGAIAPEDFKAEIDLADYRANPPSLEVLLDPKNFVVEVRDDQATATRIRAQLKRSRLLLPDKTVLGPISLDTASLKRTGPRYELALPQAIGVMEDGKKYVLEVTLERRDRNGTLLSEEKRSLKFTNTGTYQQSGD